MDRFYTTINVIERFQNLGFGVYGAIIKNRAKLEKQMISEIDSLSKHQSLFYTSVDKHHFLTVWRDSKVILLVLNIGSNSISKTTRKLGQEASSTMVPCPENIIKYSEKLEELI